MTMLKSAAKTFVSRAKQFYNPPAEPSDDEVPETVKLRLAKVEAYHRLRGHPFPDEMVRQVMAADVEDVEVWRKYRHGHCTGCLAGAMKGQDRIKSTKPLEASKPGEIGAAELRHEKKEPLLVYVDVNTSLIIGVPIVDKSMDSYREALKTVVAKHKLCGW